jgi:hypothetical protein
MKRIVLSSVLWMVALLGTMSFMSLFQPSATSYAQSRPGKYISVKGGFVCDCVDPPPAECYCIG